MAGMTGDDAVLDIYGPGVQDMAYCGECGNPMSVKHCGRTGQPHALMKLYLRPQVVEASEGSESPSSPTNPISAIFTSLREKKSTRDEGERDTDGVTVHAVGASGIHHPIGDTAKALQGEGEARPQVNYAAQEEELQCLGLTLPTVAKLSVGLLILAVALGCVAIGLLRWLLLDIEIHAVDPNIRLLSPDKIIDGTVKVNYGLFRMCNDTSIRFVNDTFSEDKCGDFEFWSPRCVLEEANNSVRVGRGFHVTGVVLSMVTMVGFVWVLRHLKASGNRKTPRLRVLLRAVTLLSGASLVSYLINVALFMGSVQREYCGHSLCDHLAWFFISTQLGYDTRVGSCEYGGSLIAAWTATACTFLAFSFMVLYQTFRMRSEE